MRKIGTAVFSDTSRGASHAVGQWFIYGTSGTLLRTVRDEETRSLAGQHFESGCSPDESMAAALAAARQVLPAAVSVAESQEWGYDVLAD